MVTDVIAGKRFFSGHSCLWMIGSPALPRDSRLDVPAWCPSTISRAIRSEGKARLGPCRFGITRPMSIVCARGKSRPTRWLRPIYSSAKKSAYSSRTHSGWNSAVGIHHERFERPFRVRYHHAILSRLEKRRGPNVRTGRGLDDSVERAYPLLLALLLGSERTEYVARRRDLDSQWNGRLHAPIYRSRTERESPLIVRPATPYTWEWTFTGP